MNAAPHLVQPRHTRSGPVFVIGHARSGTSLTCRLLLDHLGVNFGTESQFVVRYQRRLAQYGDLTDERCLRRLLQDIGCERFFARTRQNFGFTFDVEQALQTVGLRTYAGALRAIFEQFAAYRGLTRWGDKTPEYCRHLPLVYSLFPDAQFVHVVRDGRAVAQSTFDLGFGPKNAYEAALEWADTLSHIARFRDAVPSDAFLQIRYEDLLRNAVATMNAVGRFLGVENHAAAIDAAAPRLHAWVRGDNAWKWKQRLTWREIECFEAFAGASLIFYGYDLQFRPRTGSRSVLEPLMWRLHAAGRRATNRRYWLDNWYKLGLRVRDVQRQFRDAARARPLTQRRASGG